MNFKYTSNEMVEHYWEDIMVLMLELSEPPHDPWMIDLHDDSLICDIIIDGNERILDEANINIKKRYGVKVHLEDKIWQAAERIKFGN